MLEKIEAIYSKIIGSPGKHDGLGGIDICAQFNPDARTARDITRNLNAAFLITLCGQKHSLYQVALNYLQSHGDDSTWKDIAAFYLNGLRICQEEISARCVSDEDFANQLQQTNDFILRSPSSQITPEIRRSLWGLFFPEGVFSEENRVEKIRLVREQREVKVTRLNTDPIHNPAREMIFTSNVLLTLPENISDIDSLPFSKEIIGNLKSAAQEEQIYWYNHPIQIGVEPERNQVLFGLRGLNQMMAFEIARGNASPEDQLTCILSVSVTHKGLHAVARKYLEEELKKIESLPHLKVFLFTEVESKRVVEEMLYPAAVKYLDVIEIGGMADVIGVDGEYGKHYSFLKAVSALWKVVADKQIKAVFKFDLEQIFPQEALVKETGKSTFEHFKTPLWGADGLDKSGECVHLGMLAGGLVTQEDMPISIYTPNVKYPPEMQRGEGIFFYSRLPMALSTEAEVCMRYPQGRMNGQDYCLQRAHVIGGMTGILVNALRRFRPFSPTFIGRTEDHAYLLSVLFKQVKGDLRYAHESGLIMRQDFRTVSAEALKAGAVGRYIGELVRILLFTYYARALPWSVKETRTYLQPFSSCFISKIPLVIVHCRIAMMISELFNAQRPESDAQATAIQRQGVQRLSKAISYLTMQPNPLIERTEKERKAWELYYNILDTLELNLSSEDFFALKLQRRAQNFLDECRVNIGK